MDVQLFRIDDRLIHGQVILGWAKYLNSSQIILCDDEVAGNDWEVELYLSCVPADLQAQILDVHTVSRLLSNGIKDADKTIVLIKSPDVLCQLIETGYVPPHVNLGGLHFGEDRKKYLSYVFLSEQEISRFRECIEQGIEIYCQDVPNAHKYSLSELLENNT